MKAGLIFMAVGAGLLAYSSDVDSVKAGDTPPLISAILKEDKELYSKEMSRLLNQPMAEFKEAVSFKTERGDTIFHLMAGVKSHQEFFAKEMRTLSFLVDLGSRLKGSKEEKKNLSLGGVNIEIPFLEDTELGQAIDKQDASAVYEIKNQKGLLPKHVAESENNLPAYSALADMENLLEDISTKDILMMSGVAGAGMENLLEDISTEDIFIVAGAAVGGGLGALIGGVLALSVSEGYVGDVGFAFGGLPVGMLTGGFVGGACYELFQKKKLKRMSNNAMKAPAVPRTNPL